MARVKQKKKSIKSKFILDSFLNHMLKTVGEGLMLVSVLYWENRIKKIKWDQRWILALAEDPLKLKNWSVLSHIVIILHICLEIFWPVLSSFIACSVVLNS